MRLTNQSTGERSKSLFDYNDNAFHRPVPLIWPISQIGVSYFQHAALTLAFKARLRRLVQLTAGTALSENSAT